MPILLFFMLEQKTAYVPQSHLPPVGVEINAAYYNASFNNLSGGQTGGTEKHRGVGTKTKKAAHGGFFITDAALLGLLCRHRDRLCQ